MGRGLGVHRYDFFFWAFGMGFFTLFLLGGRCVLVNVLFFVAFWVLELEKLCV